MKEWFSISRWKSFGMDKLMICFLIGVFLLVICIPTGERRKEEGEVAAAEDTEALTQVEALETRMEAVLQKVQGVGQVDVMITVTGEYNQIEGVVVVAQGADLPQVRQDIMEAAQALFPIAAHKIKICKMVE